MRIRQPFAVPIRHTSIALLALGLVCASYPQQVAHAAGITVTTTSDSLAVDGKCSLREAIIAANTDSKVDSCAAGSGNDTISIPDGTFKITLAGQVEDAARTGDFDISDSVTIAGDGRNDTIIDGNKLDRVFHIRAGTVTISDLTVRNGFPGQGGNGGGILNSGTLTLNNLSVSNNVVETKPDPNGNYGGFGGGIYNDFYATFMLNRSSVRYNRATALGGGIDNNFGATFTIADSVINDNRASDSAGGAISNGGELVILRSTVAGNSAYFAGAIYNYDNVTINNSAILNNQARFAGAVDNQRTMLIAESLFAGNKATGGDGGAIRNYPGTLTLQNTTLSGNFAATNGGAIWNGANIPNSRVGDEVAKPNPVRRTPDDPLADSTQAAVVTTAVVNLNNVTIANNIADNNSDGKGNGGGLFNASYVDGDRIRVSNSIIANNQDRGNQAPDCAGQISSKGYNLVRSIKGCAYSGGSGNKLNLDPKLGPLQYNGGPTKTHALLSGSPARDAANPGVPGTGTNCITIDQRGVTRPQDGNGDGKKRCDMGAFEYTSSAVKSTQLVPDISEISSSAN